MTDEAVHDHEDGEEAPSGAPMWMTTFADLMALLMCFFVLLLSFSEIEAKKYKQVAGSMNKAFGVQRKVPTMEIPKGTSIIAREFSPGKPDPTALVTMMQQETTDDFKVNLDFTDSGLKGLDSMGGALPEESDDGAKDGKVDVSEEILEAARVIARALEQPIEEGLLEVVALPERVAIRVREQGSFDSGSAEIRNTFIPILNEIVATLGEMRGEIVVAGHTDDRPISTLRYPSNWELSSARAAAFVRYMTEDGAMPESRIEIRAYAATRPVARNDSAANRARNRRVEVSLVVGEDQPTAPIGGRGSGEATAAGAESWPERPENGRS